LGSLPCSVVGLFHESKLMLQVTVMVAQTSTGGGAAAS